MACHRPFRRVFASHDDRTGDLIVKVHRDRVAGLIDSGIGKPFAPAAAEDPNVVRFDGIGEFDLRLTAADLVELGFVDQETCMTATAPSCVRYAKDGQGLSFSVEAGGGRVLAISNAGGDRSLHTETGGIRLGLTLADLRTVFAGYRIEEHFDADFGQGSNGVIVNGQGGAMAFSLDDASATTPSSAASHVAGRDACYGVAGETVLQQCVPELVGQMTLNSPTLVR